MIDGGVGNRRKEDEDGGSEHAYDAGRRRARLLGAHAVLFLGSFHAPPPTGPTIKNNNIFQDGIHIHTHVYTYIYVARDGHGQ